MDLESVRQRLHRDFDRLRSPAGYLRAGAPRYETLFGRDSLIAAWQTLTIDPSIAAATLRVLASFQGRRVHARSEEEPGKILHEHRFDAASRAGHPEWEFPYYGSVDATLLFLILAGAYVRETRDAALASELWPSLQAAHGWISAYGDVDGDGFVEYTRKNPQGLFHQGWKDGSADHLRIEPPVALVEVQGYAVAAHRAFADLARSRGEPALAASAAATAGEVREQIDRRFWMPDAGFYGLALDGGKRLRRAITSNPGHLLLTDVVPEGRLSTFVARLFADDLWTPYGLRTHSTREPDFDPYGYHTGTVWPHDNWFLWRGLHAAGRPSEARQVRQAVLSAYEALGTIPELYAVVDDRIVDLSTGLHGPRANPLQAWSVGALLDMLSKDAAPVTP